MALPSSHEPVSRSTTQTQTLELSALQRAINGLPPASAPTPSRGTSYARDGEEKEKGGRGGTVHAEYAGASGTDGEGERVAQRQGQDWDRQRRSDVPLEEEEIDDFEDALDYQPGGGSSGLAEGVAKGTGPDAAATLLPPETVHDPYVKSQWARIKKLSDPVPPMRPLSAGAVGAGEDSAEPTSADALAQAMDAHFRRVLALQDEIASMHLALENSGDVSAANRRAAPSASTATASQADQPGGAAPSGSAQGPAATDDDAGFTALERREAGVKDVFERVDELARVLQAFHGMEMPKLAFEGEAEGGDRPGEKERGKT